MQVVVGGGAISAALVAAAPEPVKVFSIRALSADPRRTEEVIAACADASYVIYLAYHHTDVATNVRVLEQLLRALSVRGWRGRFVFVNTQATLPELFHDRPMLSGLFGFDAYTITKRRQSAILRQFSSELEIIEVYLPVVVGAGTGWQRRLTFIAAHKAIRLPSAGGHAVAWLPLPALIRWLWNAGSSFPLTTPASGGVTRLFLYETLGTFADLIEEVGGPSTDVRIRISAIRHPFRYGGLTETVKQMARGSPIGYGLQRLLHGLRRTGRQALLSGEGGSETPGSIDAAFVPRGTEYQFYATSVDLTALPFPAVRTS